MQTLRIWLRKDDMLLRNARGLMGLWGYYIVRTDKANDITPPENSDFRRIVRRFGYFVDLWKNIKWENLTKEDRKQFESMKQEMMEAILGW